MKCSTIEKPTQTQYTHQNKNTKQIQKPNKDPNKTKQTKTKNPQNLRNRLEPESKAVEKLHFTEAKNTLPPCTLSPQIGGTDVNLEVSIFGQFFW